MHRLGLARECALIELAAVARDEDTVRGDRGAVVRVEAQHIAHHDLGVLDLELPPVPHDGLEVRLVQLLREVVEHPLLHVVDARRHVDDDRHGDEEHDRLDPPRLGVLAEVGLGHEDDGCHRHQQDQRCVVQPVPTSSR